MRSNAALKIIDANEVAESIAQIFELKLVVPAPVEAQNDESVDFEEFMNQYGMTSEFA